MGGGAASKARRFPLNHLRSRATIGEQDETSIQSRRHTKAECIEMLRGLILRNGHTQDRAAFGFEAEQELRRLGLWEKLGGADTPWPRA